MRVPEEYDAEYQKDRVLEMSEVYKESKEGIH